MTPLHDPQIVTILGHAITALVWASLALIPLAISLAFMDALRDAGTNTEEETP